MSATKTIKTLNMNATEMGWQGAEIARRLPKSAALVVLHDEVTAKFYAKAITSQAGAVGIVAYGDWTPTLGAALLSLARNLN